MVAVVAAPLLISGCADMAADSQARELCTQYQQLVTTAEDFREQDLAQATADDLRAAADHFRDELNQVQAVSEGRLDTAISTLEANLDSLRQGAIDAGEDVRQTVAPLWEDDLEQVAESWAVLRDVADTWCEG